MSQALACNNNDCNNVAEELVRYFDGKVRAYCHKCADGEVFRGAHRVGSINQ